MSNLNIDQLLNLAYDIAKTEYQARAFAFSSIWSKTWKNAIDFKKEPVSDWIGLFYVQLQLDPRFVNCPLNTLRLKEFMNYNDYKSLDKLAFFGEEQESSEELVSAEDLKELDEAGTASEVVEEVDDDALSALSAEDEDKSDNSDETFDGLIDQD